MAFSSSSPVRNIELYVSWTGLHPRYETIGWEWHDGTNWNQTGMGAAPDIYGASAPAIATTLFAKAAAGTLTDLDGNQVVPVIRGTRGPIQTLDDLIAFGYYNPLLVADYNRYWNAQRKALGVLQQRGTVTNAANGAPDQIDLRAGFVPRSHEETGQGRVWLDQWENTVSRETGDLHDPSMTVTIFQIQLDISRGVNLTPDGLDSYSPVVGLRAFLNGIRTAGAALGTDFSNFASWSGRTFNLTSTQAGSTAFSFRVDRIHHTTAAPVTGCWIECVITAGTYDREALATALNTYQVIAGATTTISTEVPFGHWLTPIQASRIELDQGRARIYGSNGLVLFGVRNRQSNIETKIPLGSHRIVDFDDLPDATYRRGVTDHTIKQTPLAIENPHVNEVHFRGTTPRTDGIYDTLRVREPIGDNRIAGIATPLHVDNQGTQRLNLLDENDVQIILLEPGEALGMRFVSDLEGGQSLITAPHTRRWTKLSQSVTGGLDGSPAAYWSFDANHWALLPQVPAGSVVHNGGAFGAGNRTFTNTSDFIAANIPAHPWAIDIAADGHLRLSQRIQIRVDSDVSGVIPSGSRTMIYRKRGTTLTLIGEAVLNEPISSGISRQILAWEAEDEVEEGDIIVTVLVFAKTSTIGSGNMDVTLFSRNLELDRQINRSL